MRHRFKHLSTRFVFSFVVFQNIVIIQEHSKFLISMLKGEHPNAYCPILFLHFSSNVNAAGTQNLDQFAQNESNSTPTKITFQYTF